MKALLGGGGGAREIKGENCFFSTYSLPKNDVQTFLLLNTPNQVKFICNIRTMKAEVANKVQCQHDLHSIQ